MNNLENQIYQIVDVVVECCAVECESGTITKQDVLSKCKKENATIARYMLTYHLRQFGLSNTTISQLYGCSIQSVKNMLANHDLWLQNSRAYRIANNQVIFKLLSSNSQEIE